MIEHQRLRHQEQRQDALRAFRAIERALILGDGSVVIRSPDGGLPKHNVGFAHIVGEAGTARLQLRQAPLDRSFALRIAPDRHKAAPLANVDRGGNERIAPGGAGSLDRFKAGDRFLASSWTRRRLARRIEALLQAGRPGRRWCGGLTGRQQRKQIQHLIIPLLRQKNHDFHFESRREVRRWLATIAAVMACGFSPAAAQAGPAGPYPPNTVLLLVASWCAPCHAELAQLEAISKAASPFAVRVMLVDDSRHSRRMVAAIPPQRQWAPDPSAMTAARKDLLARTPGLPYAVAIGAGGQPCADHRGGIDPQRVKSLVAQCHR
ncbi:TlpA family protein disulfide reductase [Sphingomonas mucosissima]|uniref:TlpA family protein disulfide reductase n=1 Tax=Sphingomonas mucosissima TaxID=370959 RepID=UPI001B804CF8|nr:hypothetical protein [Sphingomonas mucosissima]